MFKSKCKLSPSGRFCHCVEGTLVAFDCFLSLVGLLSLWLISRDYSIIFKKLTYTMYTSSVICQKSKSLITFFYFPVLMLSWDQSCTMQQYNMEVRRSGTLLIKDTQHLILAQKGYSLYMPVLILKMSRF